MATTTNYAEHSDPNTGVLAARGFDGKGNRSGGILQPVAVEVGAGQVLVRFFAPGGSSGRWWFTPYELWQLRTHLGHDDLTTGRASGYGVMQKAAVVMKEWRNAGLSEFRVARLSSAFSAYFGEGDGAYAQHQPVGGATETYVKGLLIVDSSGRQRYVRQVFIPGADKYDEHFRNQQAGQTDADATSMMNSLPHAPCGFEA